MRQPQRNNRTKVQTCSVASVPAPTAGWNSRSGLAEMKPNEAVALENWFPGTAYCEGRGGMASHATGITGNGKTLAIYNKLDGTSKMFCMTASGVYDVSGSGAVAASVATSTNGKWQYVNFGDGTNNYLIAVNGVNKPLYLTGTTWTSVDGTSSPALTGLTTTDIINVFVFKGRLIFIQKNSLSFWYLAAGAAGGALTEFDLSTEAVRGGYLMAGASWTLDAGTGVDDYAVFVTSEGEAIVYQGNNPSSAASWAKIGTYYVGRPLGRRCLSKFGGDLVVLTESGAFPLSKAVLTAAVSYENALSYNIEPSFVDSARLYGTIFGWETTVYPARSAMIVNVPNVEDGTHVQYVMNTITKAWCKFTGWDAECFAVFGGELYYADGTTVYKAWTGSADAGTNIVLYGKQAFNYFGDKGRVKHFDMFQAVMAVNGSFSYLTDIDVDFRDNEITGVANYSVSNRAIWDTDVWDNAYWASGLDIVKEWTSPAENVGYCAAGKIKITTNTLTVQWMSSNYMYRTGGPLG
jgi:hypothetical protein